MKKLDNFYVLQAMRLSSLDKFPFHEGGQLELARALQESSKSRDHAERVIGAAVEQNQCPTPNGIRSLATITPAEETVLPRTGCDVCGGMDWMVIEDALIVGDRHYSAARRCDCARGRRLASMDAERQAK